MNGQRLYRIEYTDAELDHIISMLQDLEASRQYPTIHHPDYDGIYKFCYDLMTIRSKEVT